MSLYRAPGEFVRFGDIFEAPHLFDTYLRADAVPLGVRDLPPKYAPKFGQAIGADLSAQPAPLYSPNFPQRENHDFVLGHGRLQRAVLVSDNCTVATLFGYDRESGTSQRPAAVRRHPRQARGDRQRRRAAAVQPLRTRARQFFSGGVVDFRHLFMVEARDVDPGLRRAALVEEVADDLEARFSAFVVCRGPNVVDRNADKLTALLEAGGVGAPAAKQVGAGVADVLGIAWRVEGGALEDAAEAADGGKPAEEPVRFLTDELRALAAAAEAAAASLEAQLANNA